MTLKFDLRDTAAVKNASAYIILNKKGQLVARLTGHHGNACTVNIWQEREAAERCRVAYAKATPDAPTVPNPSEYVEAFEYQSARATGYGYDKFTAALAGMWIDGHKLTDHCGARLKAPKSGVWPSNAKARKGYHLANHGTFVAGSMQSVDKQQMLRDEMKRLGVDDWTMEVRRNVSELIEQRVASGQYVVGYRDQIRLSGLEYLTALGYRVICAI